MKPLQVSPLLLQLHRHLPLFSGKQNGAELISARECSLVIYYALPYVNCGKAIFCSRKQTMTSMPAYKHNRKQELEILIIRLVTDLFG